MRINNSRTILPKHILIILILSIIVCSISYAFPSLFWAGEKLLYKFQINHVDLNNPKEKIIYVLTDDRSTNELGTWPFPRKVHAKTIENMSEARTIAVDIAFFETSNPENDQLLSEAIQKHGNVVLVNYIDLKSKTSLRTHEMFSKYGSNEGYVNYKADPDFILRKYNLFIEDTIDNKFAFYPSFVFSTLEAHGYSMTLDYNKNVLNIHKKDDMVVNKSIKLDENYSFWINNIPQEELEIYEMSDVYNGKIPPETFKDALVVFGFTAHGIARPVQTVNGYISEPVMFGNSINSLLSGFNPLEISRINDAILSGLFFFFCAFLTLIIPVPKNLSFLIPVILSICLFIFSFILFKNNIIYIHSFDYIFWIIFAFFVSIIIKFVDLTKSVSITKIPINYIFKLESLELSNLNDFLLDLGNAIGKETGVTVIEPVINDKHEIFKNINSDILTEFSENGIMVIEEGRNLNYYKVLVSHINLDGETERSFTLLKVNNSVSQQALSSVAALIMTSSLYFKAIQKSKEREELFYDMILCMAAAIDAKDPITAGHSQRVSDLSFEIGELLGLSTKQLGELKLAGIIHDIGKIGINDIVLNKPGIFTAKEFAMMKEHPEKGNSIMKSAKLSSNIIDGILNHHERLDGKGYPRGLKEEEIGLFSRIIKIADVYDALISNRQYKAAWSIEKACNILYLGKDKEFDPLITDAFLEKFAPEGWQSPLAEAKENIMDLNSLKDLVELAKELHIRLEKYLCETDAELSLYKKELTLNNKNTFFSVEWGEYFATHEFLVQSPSLIGYEEITDSYCYAFSCNQRPVSRIVYYFAKNYLSAGVVDLKIEVYDYFTLQFGDPSIETDEAICWDKGKFYILLVKSLYNKVENTNKLIFFTKQFFEEENTIK